MKAGSLDDLRPRAPDRLSRGAALAIIAHLGLLVALSLGVRWNSSEPEGVEAELWSAVPQTAAPRATAPEPPPKPAPAPEPPKPAPAPKVEPPPPPPPEREAEIAREKREQKEKLDRQRLEEEKQRQEQEKQRQEQERRERERERAQREAEEARREAAEKKAEAEHKKAELEKQKKAEAERLAKESEKWREQALNRITGEAAATGAPGSTGTAAQSAGPSAAYAGRIKARIKPNIVFTDEVAGNPVAAVEVKVAPDGTIVGRRLVTSSGHAGWDEAVLRAIDRTAVLPRNPDGPTPPSMLIEFRPRDF